MSSNTYPNNRVKIDPCNGINHWTTRPNDWTRDGGTDVHVIWPIIDHETYQQRDGKKGD